jgi:hypothetical protein
MDISRVDTLIGLFGLFPIVATFAIFAVRSPLGAVSLPCMTILTSFTYFYLMPVVALAGGDTGFFGMYISDMLWMHFAVLLYNLGAIGAFLVHARTLNANPEPAYPWDRSINNGVYFALWALAIAGVAMLAVTGKLNITGDEAYQMAADVAISDAGSFGFLSLAYFMLVPLTLILLIRERFSLRSIAILALVLGVLLQAGVRILILMLLVPAAFSAGSRSAFCAAPSDSWSASCWSL